MYNSARNLMCQEFDRTYTYKCTHVLVRPDLHVARYIAQHVSHCGAFKHVRGH